MKRTQSIVLIVLAVLFVLLAVYYVVTPAQSLLPFMPGYAAGDLQHHTKHALAALILAAGCGVLLWFSTGRKQPEASASSEQD